MKKLMIMTNTLTDGGAEKVLQTVLNRLDRSAYDVTVYSMHREKIDPAIFQAPFHYKVVFDGDGLMQKIKGRIFRHGTPRLFHRLFIRGAYDAEIAFIEGESTKIVSGAYHKNTKKIAWVHTDMIRNAWTDFLYDSPADEADVYRAFDEIVCVSAQVQAAFTEKYGLPACVRYNPVDSEEIRRLASEPAGAPDARPLLVTVGRLEPPKGYPRLLQSVRQLTDEGLRFTLWILGDGSQRGELQAYIDGNGLQDTVKLLGFHRNPYKYIDRADAFVCSSYVEGFSTAATEALILGKPIYTTDCPGMAELFGGTACGEILPNTDDSVTRLLRHAVTDEATRAQYAENARRRAEAFDIQTTMTAITALFDS